MKFEPIERWSCHIAAVHQAREMSAAVACLALQAHVPAAAAHLEALDGTLHAPDIEVPDALVEIAGLVLEDVNKPAHSWPRGCSAEGRQVLGMLQAVVFPGASGKFSLIDLVCHTSLQQAVVVCHVCELLLRDVICDGDNCVSLLLAARAQRWPALERRCLQVATEQIVSLGDELHLLPRDALLHVLSSDSLQVASEMDAWQALAQWLEAQSRSVDVAMLLVECVRVLQLSREDLIELDAHPAVRACGRSSRLVAAAYLLASGHEASLCGQLCTSGLWARVTAQQPRTCLLQLLEPVTPERCRSGGSGAAAVAATPVTDLSDASGSAAGGMLLDVIPMQLQSPAEAADKRPAPEPAAEMELCASPTSSDRWLLSDDDWEDATDATLAQVERGRRAKRLRSI